MTDEQIEKRLEEAKREDGTFDGDIIIEMNKQGIYFAFMTQGVWWKRGKFE